MTTVIYCEVETKLANFETTAILNAFCQGLERGPLSLVSTIEELLGRNSSDSGLENREFGLGNALRWPRDTI
jgi:hypothetical protein